MAQEPPVINASEITPNDKLMAALSYIIQLIVPVIILVSEDMKARPYQRYHALQSLGLFVASLLYSILACVLFFACTVVTAGIATLCAWIVFFVPLIPAVYYAYLAYTAGTYFEIPVITQFMVQQGWLTKPAA
jgi:uncharacterized membrane protein